MPFFKYKAKNKFGESVKGKVEAQTQQQAASELMSRDLLVIDIKPLTEDSLGALRNLLGGVGQADIVNMTRQLATMITAGLPLVGALSILVRQSKQEVSKLVATILQEIEGGSTFAKALEQHKKVFSRIYVQLVQAGEAGGVLDQVLERLADNLEKEKEFRSKTKGAMIYPVIVVLAMIVVAMIMMIFVVPRLTEMYQDFGAQLPLATRALISASNFFVSFWWVVLAAAGGGVFAFRRWQQTESGERAFDQFLFKIPILGELRKKIVLTEFTRTLALLLGAGVSLLRSLEIVTEGVGSITYREAFRQVAKQVEKGVPMSEALGRYDIFPPILYQMMGVGEETGKLDEILKKLSNYFESESEQAVKNMTAALEPMIMIVLGLGVGAMVIAIIVPIYNLTAQF